MDHVEEQWEDDSGIHERDEQDLGSSKLRDMSGFRSFIEGLTPSEFYSWLLVALLSKDCVNPWQATKDRCLPPKTHFPLSLF